MPGVFDYTGSKIATLDVGQMIRRNPEPVYTSECRQCGARGQSVTQRQCREGSARCRAAGHGKIERPTSRDLLREQKRIAAEREAEREAAEREASAARMEAETADWERPTKYAPTPTKHVVMSERERMELRAFKEAEEAERAAADAPRLEAERKQVELIAELQEEQQRTLRQLHSLERERVATGRDDAFQIDPATIGEGIPIGQIDAWHAAQSTQFLADNPSYFPCKENEAVIIAYIERNAPGLKLLSAVQLTAAYKRLKEFGLLKEKPAPVVQPTPQPARVNLAIEREQPKEDPNVEHGWDWTTGQPMTLTARQVLLLSAEDYRRFKKLDKAALELPNVGPGPRGFHAHI